MKTIVLLAVLACLLSGCTKDYHEVKEADLSQTFILNSSPTFQGYWYQGSDASYHYFTSKWKYGADKRGRRMRAICEDRRNDNLYAEEIASNQQVQATLDSAPDLRRSTERMTK